METTSQSRPDEEFVRSLEFEATIWTRQALLEDGQTSYAVSLDFDTGEGGANNTRELLRARNGVGRSDQSAIIYSCVQEQLSTKTF